MPKEEILASILRDLQYLGDTRCPPPHRGVTHDQGGVGGGGLLAYLLGRRQDGQ